MAKGSRKGQRQSNYSNKKRQAVSRSRGARREAHFDAGLSAERWCVPEKVHKDRKDKRKNRRVIREQAINDSRED